MSTVDNKIRILIVDDDNADRFLFKEFLSQIEGYEYSFVEAAAGDEALSLYDKESSDCVILDFMMQDMTGIEFLEILHKKDMAVLPTVFISGHLNPLIVNRAKELGVSTNLDKSGLTAEDLHLAIMGSVEQNASH